MDYAASVSSLTEAVLVLGETRTTGISEIGS
jgi:hypothetical protein